MNVENQLIFDQFIEGYGSPDRPDPTAMGNYKCCDECKRNCEKLAALNLEDDSIIDSWKIEGRMGFEAFEWAIPALVKYFLTHPTKENLSDLEAKMSSRRIDDLSESRREALDNLMGFVRASAELDYYPAEYDDD